jgi:dTDP-4-dehydrorhamnose 3,5-epimerase
MLFSPTSIDGVWLVKLERRLDERGYFARTWCRDEFLSHGLNAGLVQCSLAYNCHEGTLRGMHLQKAPYGECKLVRCIKGSIYDVVIDLRPNSPTHRRHLAVELDTLTLDALYVPEGCAHGYLTLTDDTEVMYQMSTPYAPDYATGIRWNDPAFSIPWPTAVRVISPRDATFPDYSTWQRP